MTIHGQPVYPFMAVKLEASLGEKEGVAMERTFLRCFSNELQLNTDELQLNTEEIKLITMYQDTFYLCMYIF